MPNKSKSELTRRALGWFKPHPLQAALFGDLPKGELDALVNDLKAKGQRVPVEALPDGTLVAGHQRLEAAQQLGWAALDVKIRHDLVGAPPEKVEAELIDDNYYRRQLSPLQMARCCLRQVQIACGGLSLRNVTEKVKKAAALRMDLSLRELNRYLLVLKAPAEIQQAFDRKELSLKDAGRAANSVHRDLIARRIGAGKPAKKVVAEVLRSPEEKKHAAGITLTQLASHLERVLTVLGEADALVLQAVLLPRYRPVLQKASNELARILGQGT